VPARVSSGQGEVPGEGQGEGTTPASSGSSGAQQEEKESDVQAALADILNMEVRKAQVKEVRRHASAMQAPCKRHASASQLGRNHERMQHAGMGGHALGEIMLTVHE
jgi:hypothetical protein